MHPNTPHSQPRQHAGHTARARRAVLAFVGAVLAFQSHAAMLGSGAPQQTTEGIAVPITLFAAPGDTIASMQFSLVYDTRAFGLLGATAGPAAAQAGKDVIAAQHTGSATIIVAGFNQAVLEGGLVATIFLEPLGDLALPNALNIRAAVFADPDGDAIDPQDPGNNPSDPEPSPGPDPDDDKSNPPPADPVEGETPDPATPDRNYVNPGYGSRVLDDDLLDGDTPSAQGGDNTMGDTTNSGAIMPASGGGAIPGAPGQPAASSAQPGSDAPAYIPGQSAAAPTTAYPAGRPNHARNTGAAPQTPSGSPSTNPTPGSAASDLPGPTAANMFQNGTDRPKSALLFDSNAPATFNSASRSPIPLLLALVIATLFAGGAYYWRQAAPKARR